jgi:hypothetical protein
MKKTKYVIIDGSAIVFSAAILHKDMVGFNQKAEGAGFVIFQAEQDSYGETIIVAKAYGKSESLGVESRGDVDSRIITRQISNADF